MPNPPLPERELVVVTKPDVGLRATAAGLASVAGADVAPLDALLRTKAAHLRPLFGISEERLDAAALAHRAAGRQVPALSRYYRVHADDAQLDALARQLAASPQVQAAYVKPAAQPAGLNDMQPKAGTPPAQTPDFSAHQGYLDAAPGGIGARFAWTLPGGRGAGVRIVDVEGGWNFAHEDLAANLGGLVGGTGSTDPAWVNHGTAVLGAFGGDGIGVVGICPEADVSAISMFGLSGSAEAIHAAADRLAAGDILLIELQRNGPRFNYQDRPDQRGTIPVEWWPDDFDAIRYATAKGVIVVQAAANGAEDLDDPIYDAPAPGFPADWSNPFRRGGRDSGAILVGAGEPPPNTHGADWGPDRSRAYFSNYGSIVDAQGWGHEVTTTGFGDLQGGANANAWYTDHFAGTSAAAPIIVGALGCLQGVLRARGASLTPSQARAVLRATGSPQQASAPFPATQRVGSRPDLAALLAAVDTEADPTVPLYRYWNPQIPDHFYTTNFGELGNGTGAWVFEGVAGQVHLQAIAGTVPFYRYWNSQIGDHFYTTDYSELGGGKYGWVYEGVACYVHDQPAHGAIPLYRYWNTAGRDHFYTTDLSELGNGKYGWVLEKIQCYVHATPAGPPAIVAKTSDVAPPPTFDTSGGGVQPVDGGTIPPAFAFTGPR